MTTVDKLEICKQTRKYAADTLLIVLKKLLELKDPISEVILRDAWLSELRKNKKVFPDGWYIPPPHGITVLFGTDTNTERINFKSLRPEEKWPSNDVFLNTQNGIAYLFASPVDSQTGIIGDFALNLYFGKNTEIKKLMQTIYRIDHEIFDYINVGMKLSEIASFAKLILEKNSMINEIFSVTDEAKVNIGHTIPDSFEVPKNKEWNQIKDVISKKRIFVNENQVYVLKTGDAITIEPRPRIIINSALPSSLSFHTIGLFKENGEKELLTDFNELFTLAGMNYMM